MPLPETLKGLWKQRLRWAQGGAEVFLKNIDKAMAQRKLSNVATVFEYCLTTIWAFSCLVSYRLRSPTYRVVCNIELTHIAATHTANIVCVYVYCNLLSA